MALLAFIMSCCILAFILPNSLLPKILEAFSRCCAVVASATTATPAATTTTFSKLKLFQQQVKLLWFVGLSAIPIGASAVPSNTRPEHIFLLAGQSNMMGHGGLTGSGWDCIVPPECQPHPSIFRLNADSTWTPAREPIHGGIFPTIKDVGVGPSMAFARHLLELVPSYGTIGLVPCAYDWTNLREWAHNSTEHSPLGPKTLYQNLIERARASTRAGGKIAALFWWQGGKDAIDFVDASKYAGRLKDMFENIRADLGMPDLPILMVILSKEKAQYTKEVRDAQLSVKLPKLIKIDPPDFEFLKDGMHASTVGQVMVGKAVAEGFNNSRLGQEM